MCLYIVTKVCRGVDMVHVQCIGKYGCVRVGVNCILFYVTMEPLTITRRFLFLV